MPSFPSYYLNNLERKRQRSRDLSEGLDKGMAGVLGGVDRLAQMQAALDEKGLRAEALKHGRDIEAANQARADQRFAWEGEDRTRRITQGDEDRAREDAAARGEIADPDREAMVAGFGETLRGEGVEPTTTGILSKFRAAVENPAEATGRYAEEPGEIEPADVEGQTTSPEAGDILSRLKASLEPGATVSMDPSPPSAADKMEAARLRKMDADAAIAERKAKGGGGAGGVASKKEIDRQLAEIRLETAKKKAEGGQLPSVSDARAVTEIDAALGELGKIGRDASKIDTGPIADAQSVARSLVGMPDAEVVKFKSRVGEQLAQYIKGISGATVAKEERARLLENVPTFQDNDVEFDAKLERVIETLNGWRQREISAMKAAGKKTEQFGSVPSAPSADPQAAFLKTALDLQKQLGRKPTKEELQDAMRAAGVLE